MKKEATNVVVAANLDNIEHFVPKFPFTNLRNHLHRNLYRKETIPIHSAYFTRSIAGPPKFEVVSFILCSTCC